MSDKSFLLKLIVLAESDNKTYKYLKDHQNILSEIEKDGFSQEYQKEREKDKDLLESTRKLIQLPPLSSNLKSGKLAELFYRVGFYEEPTPDPKEFLKYATTDHEEVLKFLERVPGSWLHFIGLVVTELEQNLGDVIENTVRLADPNLVQKIKNWASAIILSFKKYGNSSNEEHKQLFQTFSNLILSMGNDIPKILTSEAEFTNLALIYGSEEFWNQYLALPRFSIVTNLIELINNLNQDNLRQTINLKPIINKILALLPQHPSQMLSLIRDTRMLESESSEDLHSQLLSLFKGEPEPLKTEVFDLLRQFKLTKESKLEIVEDILSRQDFEKLNTLLQNQEYIETIFSEMLQKLRIFISSDMDYVQTHAIELFKFLWTEPNISRLGVLDGDFLNNIFSKIENIPDENTKVDYINIITDTNLLNTLSLKGVKNTYIDMLGQLNGRIKGNNQSEGGRLLVQAKRRITNFMIKLKGGIKNGGRSRTGNKRSRSTK